MQLLDSQAIRKLSDDELKNILISRLPIPDKKIEIVANRAELVAAVLALLRKAA